MGEGFYTDPIPTTDNNSEYKIFDSKKLLGKAIDTTCPCNNVGNLDFSACRHIIMHKKTTYTNIPDVEKIGTTTWKRALNQTPIPKCNLALSQSCGSLKISTSRKDKIQPRQPPAEKETKNIIFKKKPNQENVKKY